MNWYIKVIKQYAVFTGRARRQEYWWFTLFNIIAYLIASMLDGMLGTYNLEVGIGFVSGVYTLFILLPSLGVSVRRLHDTDRSGWWILLAFVPIIGPLVILVFMLLDGNQGDNRFGPDPKGDNKPSDNQLVV